MSAGTHHCLALAAPGLAGRPAAGEAVNLRCGAGAGTRRASWAWEISGVGEQLVAFVPGLKQQLSSKFLVRLSESEEMGRPVLLPLALCAAAVLFVKSATFVQAPARTVEGPQHQLRLLETATMSTGLAMTGALPAFATWSEGSEPGQNIDPDSTEYYNRKVLNATAICLTFAVFLFGLVVSQARKLVENKWLN